MWVVLRSSLISLTVSAFIAEILAGLIRILVSWIVVSFIIF